MQGLGAPKFLLAAVFFALTPPFDNTVLAFSAQLARPWEGKNGYITLDQAGRRRRRDLQGDYSSYSNLVPARFALPENSNDYHEDEEENKEDEVVFRNDTSAMPFMSITTKPRDRKTDDLHTFSNRVNGAPYEQAPNVKNSLGALFQLTRPANFPGITLFHMLGTYLALTYTSRSSLFWKTIVHPRMCLTWLALVLTSSTSMVVNDYYDAKLGRDVNTHKALSEGKIPLHVAKRFLKYLYAAAALVLMGVPGVPTRISVAVGLVLTYWYTEHLKPITLLKNIVCAVLIALSPLTSGSAAMHLVERTALTWKQVAIVPLWQLVGTLFFGVMGREIMMDCTDMDDDRQSQVRTLPVVYGRRLASAAVLATTVFLVACATSGPILQLRHALPTSSWKTLALSPSARRLGFASIGSLMSIRRTWQVFQTECGHQTSIDQAVDEAHLQVLFFLASFV